MKCLSLIGMDRSDTLLGAYLSFTVPGERDGDVGVAHVDVGPHHVVLLQLGAVLDKLLVVHLLALHAGVGPRLVV